MCIVIRVSHVSALEQRRHSIHAYDRPHTISLILYVHPSLQVPKAKRLKQQGLTQGDVDAKVVDAIVQFTTT